MAVPGSGPRIPPAEKLELFFEEIAGGECCGARIFFAEFGYRPVIGRDLQQECRTSRFDRHQCTPYKV